MGDIVRALNNHAATEGVDYRPFMLLGNPESRALVADRATPRKSAGSSPDPKAKEVSQLLRRFVANVGFVSNAANFGFQKNNEPHSQFRRDMAWLARADIRSLSRAGRSESDIEGLIDGIRPPNERISLKQATLRLSEAWEEAGGFYAVGEQLDEMYGPEGAQQLDTCCQVCGERLIERRLSYLGQNISVEYSERRQVICPRCLVVEHVSPMHRQATNVVAVRSGQEFVTRVSYTNITSQPQWVYSFAFLSDPNNVSRSTAERAYKRLLERTVCRRAQQAPRSIGPGGKFDFEFRTGPVPEDFWYLLLEVNLMVDFCWNWFSFTFREKRIEDWLRSERYSSTLPRIKAGILST
ncbi:hypothetical protein [Bradyrhizobium vignae]|nr:hypothetical protein [Bradyrhizobium vignae]